KLDDRNTVGDRLTEGGERVFRDAFAEAAMGDDGDGLGRGVVRRGGAGQACQQQARRPHPTPSSPCISAGKKPSCAARRSVRDTRAISLEDGKETARSAPPVVPIHTAVTAAWAASAISRSPSSAVTKYRAWSSANNSDASVPKASIAKETPTLPPSAISAMATARPPSDTSWTAVTSPFWISSRINSPTFLSRLKSTVGGAPSLRP